MAQPITHETANLVVRLRTDEADKIRALAQKNERSVAAELRLAVRVYLQTLEAA